MISASLPADEGARVAQIPDVRFLGMVALDTWHYKLYSVAVGEPHAPPPMERMALLAHHEWVRANAADAAQPHAAFVTLRMERGRCDVTAYWWSQSSDLRHRGFVILPDACPEVLDYPLSRLIAPEHDLDVMAFEITSWLRMMRTGRTSAALAEYLGAGYSTTPARHSS